MKVLIIDDRQERQQMFLNDLYQKLKNIKDITLKSSFSKEEDTDYDIFAIHRSYLKTKDDLDFDKVRDNILEQKKYFISFSGSINEAHIIGNGHYLQIGSREFYSKKTVDFFEKLQMQNSDIEEEHLFEQMLYGKSWKLTYLLKLKNYLWRKGLNKLEVPEQEGDEDIYEELSDLFGTEMNIERIDEEIEKITNNF